MGRLDSNTTGGGRITIKKKSGQDLKTLEGLSEYATSLGLGDEVEKIVQEKTKPKLSVLQRVVKGLGAFNPAEAILTGKEKGVGSGVVKYGLGIAQGIGSAITGRDYEGTRRTFSDVAEEAGIENKWLKGGIGFLGDVLLDPSTYFGGAIAKGMVKAATKGTNLGLKGIGKVAPQAEEGLRLAGEGLQDAFGKAFIAGYKSTKGAKEDVLSFMTKKAQNRTLIAGQQMAKLGVQGLTDDQMMEVALKSALGKQSEFLLGETLGDRRIATEFIEQAKKTGDFSKIKAIDEDLASKIEIKFDTPQQQQYFDLQQTRIKEFAKSAGLEDVYSTYFPFLKKDVLNKFVKDIQKSGIRVGSEGYKKEFKNLLDIKNIELDPRQAFKRREIQLTQDVATKKFLNEFVEKYGKKVDAFPNADEARRAGFRALNEKGGFGKQVGWLGEWDAKLFNDLITPEFQTLNMLASATGFDAMTGLFKRGVTGLFLPFHVRNWVSGVMQNYEVLGVDALNPKIMASGVQMAKKIAKGADFGDGFISVAGKQVPVKQVMQEFVDRFGYGDSTFIDDMYKMFDDDKAIDLGEKIFTKERLKETVKTAGLGQESIPFKIGREIGQFIEVQQKSTAYLGALSQGKTMQEALDIATRAGFDYRVLTQFESQVLRRLIPFYSFTRKNIELQLKTLGENPQRINQIIKFIESWGEDVSQEELEGLPDYLKQTLGISLGEDKTTGLKRYVASFGTPIEAFTSLFKPNAILNVISMTNPLIKAPIEIGIGKDSFRQRDLKDVYNAKEYSESPQIIKDLLKIKEVKKNRYKKVGKNLVKIGEYTEYVADPERLLIARSLFTSRGFTYLDNIFDKDVSKLDKFLNLTTGIKAQQIDPEITKALKEKEMKRALEDLLIRLGEAKEFRTIYEPK